MIGRVFSIEEFSTYDGPGIRTTVFLKGCPLHCIWCHNPEGQLFERQIVRSPNGCLKCGACTKCGEKITGEQKLVLESINACPVNLIRECGKDYSATELCDILLKNANLLNSSGGGITFSGGEPLMQYEFLIECLQLISDSANRAIQTCGFCEETRFKDILHNVDLVLFDLKLIEDEDHIRFTGVSNRSIVNNFRILCESETNHILRMPLIPAITDTVQNVESIAKLMKQYSQDYIELLPYNKMAGGKYSSIDRTYSPQFEETRPVEMHLEIFSDYGIKVDVL